jgi:hypothetical protein
MVVSFLNRPNFAEVHTNRIRIKADKKMIKKEKHHYAPRLQFTNVGITGLTRWSTGHLLPEPALSLVYTYLVVLCHKVQGVGTSESIG